MICKKQSYLISKYLFFPLQVALGVSTSFLWEYVINTKPGKALEWNSLGNIFCTNIHPQMVPPPSGPVSPHYITWLVFHDPAKIFFSNFPKNVTLLSSGQGTWGQLTQSWKFPSLTLQDPLPSHYCWETA